MACNVIKLNYMQNIYNDLAKLLEKDERLIAEGKILKNKVTELAIKLDGGLLKMLLKNKQIKEHFFTEAEGITVFDKDKFIKFINNKEFLPNSFTAFKNHIGLTKDDEYLKDSGNVVLVWPYKDCVLEGGQDKEDTKRNEIFYNETLAPDEIDRLFEPKVLTNFKKIDKSGEYKVEQVAEQDNLIIKGNNLLALHTLKKKYRGKIKLIYIDPPYNTRTSANTFTYNNSFNHSSWLTFMKNRLEIARELLSDDGIIFIDIDHYELFYLGVLADEVFGYENRIGVLAVVHNLKGRYNEFFANSHENKVVYAKNVFNAKIQDLKDKDISDYPHKDNKGNYKTIGLQRTGDGSNRADRPNLFYPIYYNPKTNELSLSQNKNWVEILPIDDGGVERRWRWSKDKVERDWKTEIEVRKSKSSYKIYTKLRYETNGEKPKTIWFKPEYSGTTGTKDLKDLVGEKLFAYPKSVKLVKDSIKIATNDDDIVLDFFGGSGTTAQAVLDLNKEDGGQRRFIICEQMDYVEKITKERVKKVIEKNKQGSFIYMELREWNEAYMQAIQDAKTEKEISAIYKKMQKEAFFRYDVDLSKFDEKQLAKLPLADQKEVLQECLDKNHLYVNYSEIDDATYKIPAEEKKINKQFYGN